MTSIGKGIMCRGYIVFENEPTPSMIETGNSAKIKVLSFGGFISQFFSFNNYNMLRNQHPFGSSLNPFSGEKDDTRFVPVGYIFRDREIQVPEIANLLFEKKKIVLIGDYGTGKSRCIEAVYDYIANEMKKWSIAINLSEHWGAKNAPEIIAGHLDSLGIGNKIDNVLQLLNNGAIILLLDGVDEVGAQVFGVSQEGRTSIRKKALSGIKNLVQRCPSGVLLTTRAHYFDRDEEIIDARGLPKNDNTIIIKCKDEFTENEARMYTENLGIDIAVPAWLPKKPLVFQVLSLVAEKYSSLPQTGYNYITVWHYFLSAICEREANIHGSISADAVRQTLITLGALSRRHYERNGRFTLKELREAYEEVTKETPDEAGEHMLMRLCTLGRVSQESSDRCFVDEYIADGLRAEAMITSIESKQFDCNPWKVSIGDLGSNILNEYTLLNYNEDLCITCLSISCRQNHQACAEILSALSETSGKAIDCRNIALHDCEFFKFNVGIRQISNLVIRASFFKVLNLFSESADSSSSITIEDCLISSLNGVSTEKGIPSWITKSEVSELHRLSNITRIKQSDLPEQAKALLTIIHRVFFQRGTARKESALFKSGFEQDYNQHLIKDILNLLKREGIVSLEKGKEGPLYKPERAYTHRMQMIMDQLMLSKDPIWQEVLAIKIKK